jgi:hypothetical protein
VGITHHMTSPARHWRDLETGRGRMGITHLDITITLAHPPTTALLPISARVAGAPPGWASHVQWPPLTAVTCDVSVLNTAEGIGLLDIKSLLAFRSIPIFKSLISQRDARAIYRCACYFTM